MAAAADDPDGFDLVSGHVIPGMNLKPFERCARFGRYPSPDFDYAHDSDIEALSGAKRLGFIKKPVGLRELAS